MQENKSMRAMNENDFWGANPNDFLPSISIDCVIFGFHNKKIKVLLIKFQDYDAWSLPGGFVLKNQDIDDAANSILKYKTGLDDVYLKQFKTFGSTNRVNAEENKKLLNKVNRDLENQSNWFLQRFISIAYYAFVEYSKVEVHPTLGQNIKWFHLEDIPQLYVDHNEIINKAVENIRTNISIIPVGYNLLSNKFTMSELRSIYETILDKKLDRRNFQRKILASGYVKKLEEVSRTPGVKPATLFQYDMEKYKKGYSMF